MITRALQCSAARRRISSIPSSPGIRMSDTTTPSKPRSRRSSPSITTGENTAGRAASILAYTALDIITERDAGVINDEQMMQALKELDYTDGHVPEVNGVATDAYVRGSWDDIEFAFQRDRLTFDQYSELFAARRDRQRNAASDAE